MSESTSLWNSRAFALCVGELVSSEPCMSALSQNGWWVLGLGRPSPALRRSHECPARRIQLQGVRLANNLFCDADTEQPRRSCLDVGAVAASRRHRAELLHVQTSSIL